MTLHRGALAALLDRPALRRLLAVLDGDGEETRIVGGCVRNALLGTSIVDVDCATTALPEVTVRRAETAGFKAVPTGIEHGTITVVVDGEPFEVTTLREDVETDGRRARVRFGRDFRADARRRDFTINALSVDAEGRLHDYAEGLSDLAARRVRFIGDAGTRIREDYLRILRFFRFHASYATGRPDPEGLAAAVREREGLARLSAERVRSEVLKLLAAPGAAATLAAMAEHGLLLPIIGGVGEFGRFARAAAAGIGPVGRLAALAVLAEEDAERLRERLRLSNDEHQRLTAHARLCALLRSRTDPIDGPALRRLVADHDPSLLQETLAILAGEPRPSLREEARLALSAFASGVEPVPVFPLRGADLVAAGVPAGRAVGMKLARARDAWLAAGCPEDEGFASTLLRRALDEG